MYVMKGKEYELIDKSAILVIIVMNNQVVVKLVKRMKIVVMVLEVFVFLLHKLVNVIKVGLVLHVIKLVLFVMMLL